MHKAIYKEQTVSDYGGNPLIEALPLIQSKEEVIGSLIHYPYFNEEERMMEGHHRFHLIQRLFNLYQVFPVHLDIESRISRLIRQGYVGRNPLSSVYPQIINKVKEGVSQNPMPWVNDTLPRGLTIIGPSGTGKSSLINRLLNQYEQIIIHSKYKGTPFSCTQVVFIKLDCSHDGSVKGLINQFFIQVDRILGTNYFNRFGRHGKNATNTLIPIMSTICASLNIGLISIDEIQHLRHKGMGAKQMLNFFVTLSNMVKCPIIMIGTPSAMGVLQEEFRQARRGSGQGDFIFNRMDNDDYWKLFVESLWQYQWVRKPVLLSDNFINLLYEESQGILDIAVKLFMLSQIKAISTGKEEITPTTFLQVSKESLKLVQPMLKALKSGDIQKIAQFEDFDISFEEAVQRERVVLEKATLIQSSKLNQKDVNNNKLREEALFRLTLLGISKEKGIQSIRRVIKEETLNDVAELVKRAYQSALQLDLPMETKKQSKPDEDLRLVVKGGREEGISNYQSLKKAGRIKSLEEFVL